MATKAKKQKTLFVVLDGEEEHDAMVNFSGDCGIAEEVIFDQESTAIAAAEEALDGSSQVFEDTDTLIVYKLVPVVKVGRAKAIVERL